MPPTGTGDLTSALLHRATLPAHDVVIRYGVPVTSVARTLVDLARHRPLATAVAAMDFALREHMVTGDEIAATMLDCRNWPGIKRARRAVRLVDPRAESVLESVSRLVLGWLRLPVPEPQQRIADERGFIIARCDFYWDEYGVVGEADGRDKYSAREVLTKEKDRQEQLEDLGIVAVRWGWRDVTRAPQLLRHRVSRGFERGRLRDRSGFPRQWSLPSS